ncbi:MAG: oxidoreductase [Methanocellales archaeon]|nr:oxidoreductase [Methanocellales archaeon]
MGTYKADIVRALESSETNLVWLHLSECTGCTVSFLNAEHPDIIQAITKLDIRIPYYKTIMPQQGLFVDGRAVEDAALNANYALDEFLASGKPFVLAVEGAVPRGPDGTGNYGIIAEETFLDKIKKLADKALITVAVGACAAFGGMPAAGPNPTDVTGLQFLKIAKGGVLGANYTSKAGLPVINIAGCPIHPDRLLLTLAAAILDKIPADFLDEYQRPKPFFPPTHTIHENCPRRGFYDLGVLDDVYAGGGCVLKLGCRAPITNADCALRLWNDGNSMCIQAGAPCVGCTYPTFPDGPLWEDIPLEVREVAGFGALEAALAAGGSYAAAKLLANGGDKE